MANAAGRIVNESLRNEMDNALIAQQSAVCGGLSYKQISFRILMNGD